MAEEQFERLARWVERFAVDAVLTVPVLLDWEMISRVQQFNNAHTQAIQVTIGGIKVGLGNTGVGYTGSGGIPLALPSPIQIVQNYLAGRSQGANESLTITVTPATITLGSTFTLDLAITNQGGGPFVIIDSFNTAVLLPPVNIGTNTVTASPSVFSAGSFPMRVKDQSTGVDSNIAPVTFQ